MYIDADLRVLHLHKALILIKHQTSLVIVVFPPSFLFFHPLVTTLDYAKPHLLFQTSHFQLHENSFERRAIMRLSHLLFHFYLFTAVWAGGYAGALERIWLFQAYEIDALNEPDRQTVGFKCRHWEPAEELMGMVIAGYCRNGNSGYQACRPARGANRRCTYAELMIHLGRTPSRSTDGWSVDNQATGRLDVQQTAIATFNKFWIGRGVTPPDFRPYVAMKGDIYEYNDYIHHLNKVVTDAYVEHKTNDNVHLWNDFDGTRDQINIARTGDHGRHLIEAARASPHFGGMTLVTQNVGTHPVTGAAWETIDWAQTAKQARDDGITDGRTRIQDFREEFYRPDRSPRKHLMVIKSYKRAKDAANRCRRNG